MITRAPLSSAQILAAVTLDSEKFYGANVGRRLTVLDFYSAQAEIVFTTSSAVKTLPSVVLPDLSLTILAAYIGYNLTGLTNSAGSQNYLNGEPTFQVKESAAGSWTTGLTFEDECWGVNASTKLTMGCQVLGNVEVSSEIAAMNKTYEMRLSSIAAAQNNLETRGFATFIRLIVA